MPPGKVIFGILLAFVFTACGGSGNTPDLSGEGTGAPSDSGSNITLLGKLPLSLSSSDISYNCRYTLLDLLGTPLVDASAVVSPGSREFVIANIKGTDPSSVALVIVFCKPIQEDNSDRMSLISSTPEDTHVAGASMDTSAVVELVETCSIFDICSLARDVITRCETPGSPIFCQSEEILIAFLTVLFPGECLITQPIAEGIQSFLCEEEGNGTCGDGTKDDGEDCGEPTTPSCPQGQTCQNCRCINTANLCGNGKLDSGEVCDWSMGTEELRAICPSLNCTNDCTACCGDGKTTGTEQCDDATPNFCENPVDGCCGCTITLGWSCDNEQEPSVCTAQFVCGNGVPEVGEGCDDGNLTDGDGCDSNCTPTGCGNRIITDGEQCEVGIPNSCAQGECLYFCSCCGDKFCNAEKGENFDICPQDCPRTPEYGTCGNGIVDYREQCDGGPDGNSENGTTLCRTISPEAHGTFCNSSCFCCEEFGCFYGEAASCPQDCGNPVCGNGGVESGEECDDNNTSSNDGCNAQCQWEVCGDGIVNNGFEQCDTGADGKGTDSCPAGSHCALYQQSGACTCQVDI